MTSDTLHALDSTAHAASHTLDALRFPLHGSRLIEASAGTGKTWTIAALYLRLVLGHGSRNSDDTRHTEATAFARPLLPAEILVMTFTRAATKELSDRIRARLLEAARCFRGDTPPAPNDALLASLLADYADEADRRQAAWRLAMAAEAMDDAAVFTIDAWCQRMLREHAFDSGNPFDEELAADETALLLEAVQDYWRQQCYPLSDAPLDFVLRLWPDVNALHEDIRELVGQPLPLTDDRDSLGACVERVMTAHHQKLITLSRGWVERAGAIKEWLDKELAANAKAWNGKKLQSRYYTPWCESLASWARDPLSQPLNLPDSARHRLTVDGILEARKDGAPVPELPDHFDAFAELLQHYGALPDPHTPLRIHAATQVAERLAQLKRKARSFGFADMLERLDQALCGPHGARLRERILGQYPVALIDEFQDTSPLQYRLFDALYRTADNDPGTALLLIGDPKQSIYGFRGADIYSYLQARRATAGRHYVLGTNYRSTHALVAAVNGWFAQAEARAGDRAVAKGGAFLCRSDEDNELPFEPVGAEGRQEVFHTSAGPVPAMSIHHDLELRSATDSRKRFAARCAEQIVTWLNDPSAGFHHPQDGFKRLRPADIAVLVRTGKEAAAVRLELRRRGVTSVYLSDKDSVFASNEARDLLHWLRAVASPLDAPLVRAALATRTVGLSIEELAWLASDDEAFDGRSEQIRQLHAVWRDLGVLTMLRRSLHQLDLPARWLAEPEGERRLTNFLHLAELLQHASAQLDGEQALIRWLAMQIDDGAGGSEEQVVRLESDADLVKVVTVHKSKGLEYPVVCLPFACSFRRVERKFSPFLKLVDASGTREIKLDYDDDDLERADHERLREDLRLFYVALTRARHALWMGFAALKIGNSNECLTHRSAPGYLLGGLAPRTEASWQPLLEALAEQASADTSATPPCIILEATSDSVARTALQPREALPALRESPLYTADFERRWSIGSFSALVRDIDPSAVASNQTASALPTAGALGAPSSAIAGSAQTLPEPNEPALTALSPLKIHRPAEDEGNDEDASGVYAPNASTRATLPPWHRFPRGAIAGNFLHDMLEWLAGEGFALAGDPNLETALRRRCVRAGRGDWADATVEWMQNLLATPLPSLGVPLPALRTQLTEMEFWMPSARLHAGDVDALCRRHLLNAHERPALPQRALHGMVMGFADLVFEHEGRYWVLDYKSNSLGKTDADYDTFALESAMARHRYDVQAALYLLALHRLLRARLGTTYDPSRQLGGALYLFLRGIRGPCCGEYAIPATGEVIALLDTLDQQLTDEAALA
ncbi:exodeoxyribonuclease V subunit beta [Thauera aromatica]|uniref:RecBCD enzyme subunit RecB n=1 Tax=Thauera aromatica K172 TaxID=44139 RepID=A0A2R4BQ54_THAAR|nr:exodeoxyribonuclease V subunit beta [Thauera aromatica]AVR89333.1 Exodeoxyribonuclease V beta chain [Thauera aromatica K172]